MTYNGVDAAMRHKVRRQLQEVEQRYGVRVLYACESGSRGWGFASPDSDYDVRFLYVHPPEWYLRVDAPRDVIELPIDAELDVCGWEWRKALGLLKGANPTLIEWLDSPVVYQQDDATVQALKRLIPEWFSPVRARWHYYSMARKNFRGYLQGEQVRLKKYFYVLRPLLAVRWVEAGKGRRRCALLNCWREAVWRRACVRKSTSCWRANSAPARPNMVRGGHYCMRLFSPSCSEARSLPRCRIAGQGISGSWTDY